MINTILERMKAPNDRRPVWRGGVIQIMITRACNLACCNCTQGSNLAGKPMVMSLDQFERACQSLVGYTGVIGIFGGNPTMHPHFPEICEILSKYVAFEQRGLWSNDLMGHGHLCRKTFNPEFSNLNVHMDIPAYQEFQRFWPEAQPKGLMDSRHSPPFVAMKDLEDMTDVERWILISHCDINQLWSALVGVFRGELRAWFCELAGAQSMLHEHEPDYPDTGIPVKPGWFRLTMPHFKHQVQKHCLECGIPLRGHGSLAVKGLEEQVSKTHLSIYKLKRPGSKEIQVITKRAELGDVVERATDYIENGAIA